MIAGYAKNGIFDKAVKLFHAILSQACVNNKALPRRKTSSFPHNSHRIWIWWHIFNEQGFASMIQVQSFGRCSHCLWSNAKVKQCLMDYHDRSLLQAWDAWGSAITFSSILPACLSLLAFKYGKEFHHVQSNFFLRNAFVDMYVKMWFCRSCMQNVWQNDWMKFGFME